MELIFTKHAREQIVFRGFSIKEVKDAIRRGDKTFHKEKIIARFKYYAVVYRRKEDKYLIITVMYTTT